MFRINGYFLCACENLAAFEHACMRLPSKLSYQISSGSVRFNLDNSPSFTFVTASGQHRVAGEEKQGSIQCGLGDDYKDLMAGVDEVIKRGYIDDKKLGVTGGSGGGLLDELGGWTNWTLCCGRRAA